jgi:hypothetical protein
LYDLLEFISPMLAARDRVFDRDLNAGSIY